MALAHPALSTVGKKRGKKKFASAAAAQQHRELQAEWEKSVAKWSKMTVSGSVKKSNVVKSDISDNKKVQNAHHDRDDTASVSSLNSWVTGAVSSKPSQFYTGNNMIGICQMAKSNAVPIFNKDSAVEIARMRRG